MGDEAHNKRLLPGRSSWLAAIGAMLAVAAIVAAGCGSSKPSTASQSSEKSASTSKASEGSSGGGSGVAKAKEAVAKLNEKNVVWPKPSQTPFNPGHHKVAVVTCGLAGRGCKIMSEEAQAAIKAAGWTSTPTGDGKFSPTVQAGLVQHAVQEGVEGLVIISIDVGSIKSAVDAAIAKKIPISCVLCQSEPEFLQDNHVVDVTTSGAGTGEAAADYIVANSGGKGTIFATVDHAFPIVVTRAEATKKKINELCSACKWEEQEFATAELEKPGPPVFTAALASHPAGSLQWVETSSTTYSEPMIKTAVQQGRNELQFVGEEAEPEFLHDMVTTKVAPAVVAIPNNYAAWSGVDEVIREVNKMPTWEAKNLPIWILTKSEVGPYIKALPNPYESPSFKFKEMYEKIWSGK